MDGKPTHREKAEENVQEHGTQHPETLLAAIEEEAGEIARAYLDATYFDEADPEDLDEEIDDLAALLMQLRWSVEDHPMAFEPFPTAEEIEKRNETEFGTDETEPVDVGLRQSNSDRDRRNRVYSVIEDQGETTVEEVADIMMLDEEKVASDVRELKNRGKLYEPDEKLRPT
jgi:NTP pyrophosphatase (non-canonical NTP hydrolase)